MVDATSKKLLRLLQPGQRLELRRAATSVIGEIGARDPEIAEALFRALDDPDLELRLHALAAIGQLKIDHALPRLLARVSAGGPESEVAAQAAARLGPKGTRALQELMNHVAPGLRRRIASALTGRATSGSSSRRSVSSFAPS